MPIRCDEYNRVSVLVIEGDLSAHEAPAFRQMIQDRVEHPAATELVVDFEKCPFIASTGLEALLFARRLCDASGRRLSLANLDGNCRKVLEITRLTHQFELRDDLSAALRN